MSHAPSVVEEPEALQPEPPPVSPLPFPVPLPFPLPFEPGAGGVSSIT